MSDMITNLLNNEFAVYIIGVLGAFFGFLVSWKELVKIFRMVFTPASEIAHLQADAQVQIVGQAQSMGSNIMSPITKKPCVLWQLEVMERRSSGKSSRWVTVYRNYSSVAFDVSDGTGRVRLEPQHQMELILHGDVHKSSGLFSALDEDAQKTLSALGINTKGFVFNKSMRVYERYVEQDEQVYVLGKVMNKNGVMTMDGTSPLIVSDHGKLRLIVRYAWKVLTSMLMFAVVAVALFFFFKLR
jgi:hypothetical protein